MPPHALPAFRALRRIVACVALLLAFACPATASARSAKADLNGSAIHYLDAGAGADAIVFVHGWSCDASFWDAQMAALAGKRRVIAVDLIGFGKSAAPRVEYTQELLAQSLAAVMDAAGVRRAVLVGHSMGFCVTKRYLDAHPERVAGLFIVDGAYVDLPKDQPRADAFKAALARPETDTDAGWRAFVGGFVTPMLTRDTPQAARGKILDTMQGSPRQPARSAFLNFMLPGSWSPAPAALPVHAVFAETSAKGRHVREYLSGVFPDFEYEEWTQTGHFIMFDQAARLTTAIAGFADRVLRQ